jgi:drug/metabolite transporter (DMT)-like permease
MEQAVLLAVVASFFTATSSVCQRLGAKDTAAVTGFDLGLVLRLARQPIWVLGLASMILGFIFQVSALHFGDLALVQPILATELLFVFAYMTIIGSRRVKRRDWLAAAAMAAGLGVFLLTASPAGGHLHAPAFLWWLAGLATFGAVALLVALAFGWGRHPDPPRSRRAAILGIATGISWGFVAAVIKEMSSHLGGGFYAIVSNWSLYVLIGAGALSLLLSTHALSAGPLAASQPGFTIVDPLSASLLGLFLFGEHIRIGTLDLAFEALALARPPGGRPGPGPHGDGAGPGGTHPDPARPRAFGRPARRGAPAGPGTRGADRRSGRPAGVRLTRGRGGAGDEEGPGTRRGRGRGGAGDERGGGPQEWERRRALRATVRPSSR